MDLKALHSIMCKKDFHYFNGFSNNSYGNLYISFSTQCNGRGKCVDIRIGSVDNDIEMFLPEHIEYKNVDDTFVFILLNALK